MELCFFYGRARMRAEGCLTSSPHASSAFARLASSVRPAGLQRFVRPCQEQGLLGAASHQERRPKGSGLTHGQLNFHWWLPVYGSTGL